MIYIVLYYIIVIFYNYFQNHQELESALCDQLQGGMEVACEAVFGVKVLLALEDKLRGIVAI
jgi:hypothetical protein